MLPSPECGGQVRTGQDTGAHPLIMGSGWDSAWDGNLPADAAALSAVVRCSSSYETWTDVPLENENLPMNCITWYEAFAFCAWDGGRLPTEAEWNYAAAGGSEQREYPWSNPPSSMIIDLSYAVYHCTGDGSPMGDCMFGDILQVGSKSTIGDGRWGQADLAGSMWEWNWDWFQPYASSCNDCANMTAGPLRVFRGGNWLIGAPNVRSSVSTACPRARRGCTGPRARCGCTGPRARRDCT
jgi:formylglycine-generating enzyme required for sulfatase activity